MNKITLTWLGLLESAAAALTALMGGGPWMGWVAAAFACIAVIYAALWAQLIWARRMRRQETKPSGRMIVRRRPYTFAPEEMIALRERRDLTVEQAAELAGCQSNAWMYWENGLKTPSIWWMSRICLTLRCGIRSITKEREDAAAS
jgi:DNA-binding XRE family transcriptional regulator